MRFSAKICKSSTLNTWFAFGVKSANVLFFLPLIFSTFSTAESELWLLFSIFLTLQNVADFGFYNTFVRNISYAFSGATSLNIEDSRNSASGKPNLILLRKVVGTMNVVYTYVTFFIFLLGACGTYFVWDRFVELRNVTPYFASWVIVVFGTTINFGGRIFSNVLYGFNFVYLVRRWEGIFAIFSIATNIFVLLVFESFLLLTLSYQFWIVVNVIRNRILVNRISNRIYSSIVNYNFDKPTFSFIWPLAWKSGLSSLASTGVLSLSGIWYSTLDGADDLGSYLFTTKLLDSIRTFCKAPFYSKIPLISQLRSKKRHSDWFGVIFKGISIGNYLFLGSVVVLSFFGPLIFDYIGSSVAFPSTFLWLGLSLGYFFHINGAYHTHIYMSSNKVNSHINDLVSGLIFAITAFFTVRQMGSNGFVYAELIAYGLFYLWFALFFSRKLVNVGFLKLLFVTLAIPSLCLFVLIYFKFL